MPQLDIFIFLNSGIYLFIGFFGILAYIHMFILPSIGSLIKLRKKLVVTNKGVNDFQLPKIQNIAIDKYINEKDGSF